MTMTAIPESLAYLGGWSAKRALLEAVSSRHVYSSPWSREGTLIVGRSSVACIPSPITNLRPRNSRTSGGCRDSQSTLANNRRTGHF